ncbi:MAG: DoxX family protein [Anaerolineales bacterium]|nr:DoxX family protein [Anaerolineales bacterium]MCW5856233.1 DoxX family protein [Anaerolineales bacterium]
MNIILWIAQGLLGLGFIAAGYNKAFRAQQAAAQPAMAWMSAVSPPLLRFIGLAEIAGGLGVLADAVRGAALAHACGGGVVGAGDGVGLGFPLFTKGTPGDSHQSSAVVVGAVCGLGPLGSCRRINL